MEVKRSGGDRTPMLAAQAGTNPRENPVRTTACCGSRTRLQGQLKASFQAGFDISAKKRRKWFPSRSADGDVGPV